MTTFFKRSVFVLLTVVLMIAVFSTGIVNTNSDSARAFTSATTDAYHLYLWNADNNSMLVQHAGNANFNAAYGTKEGSATFNPSQNNSDQIGGFYSLNRVLLNKNFRWSDYNKWFLQFWVYFPGNIPSHSDNYIQINFCNSATNEQDGRNYNLSCSGFSAGWHLFLYKLDWAHTDAVSISEFNSLRIGIHSNYNSNGTTTFPAYGSLYIDDMYLITPRTWGYKTSMLRHGNVEQQSYGHMGGTVQITSATYNGVNLTGSITSASNAATGGVSFSFPDCTSSQSVDVPYSTSITMKGVPKTGYYFNIWGTTPTGNLTGATRTWSVTASETYAGYFTPIMYDLNFYSGNGSTGGGNDAIQAVSYDNSTFEKTKFPSCSYVKEYTVYFNYQDGSTSTASKKATYTFSKWAVGSASSSTKYSAGEVIPNLTSQADTAVKLYPTWNSSVSVTIPNTSPTRKGYNFLGWYTASSGGTKITGSTYTHSTNANVTLYAQWEEKTPSFSNKSVSCTYGGSNQDISFGSATGGFESYTYTKRSGASQLSIPTSTSNKIRVAGGTSVGTYSAVIRATNNGGSKYAEATVTVTVSQREVTLTWGTASFTYNRSSQVPTCTAGNVVSGDTVKVTVTGGQTNVGTYTATASSLSNSNYKLPSSKTKSFTINQREVTLTWGNATFTYNGSSQVPTCTAGNVVSGDSVTVTVTGAQTNAGTYTATASSLSNSNYKLPSSKTKSFTINKANFSNPTFANTTRTYNGSAQSPTVSSAQSATLTYSTSSGGSYSSTMPSRKDAGSTTIYWKATRGNNYNDRSGNFTFTINQKEVTLTWGNATFTYNGSSQVPTCTAGSVVSGDTVTVTVTGAQTNAGSYTATASKLSNSNYKLPTSNTKAFTIKKADFSNPTFGNTTRTYNGNAQSPTVSSAQSATLTYSTSSGGTYSSTMPSRKDAGSTTIYWKATRGNNYNDRSGNFTFTVNQKEVTLTWGNATFTYNRSSQVPTCTAGSVISGDSVTVTVTGAQTNAGSYTATASALDNANYKLPSSKTKSFTINQREVTLTWGNATFTYNGSSQVPTCTLGNVVSGDSVTVTVAGAQTNAGSYTATASSLNNANYKLPSSNQTTFIINQFEVTLKWGNTEFVYNGTEQVPECTVVKVFGSDTVKVTVSGGQTNASDNEYIAKAESLSNPNYKLPTANRTTTFTIERARFNSPTFGNKTVTYNKTAQRPTVTIPDNVIIKYSTSEGGTYSNSMPSLTDAGRITIYWKASINSNYYDQSGNFDFTVEQLEAKLKWEIPKLVYDGTPKNPTCTVTNACDGDIVTVILSDGQINAGTYTAIATGLSNDNYKLPTTGTSINFTINKAESSLKLDKDSIYLRYPQTSDIKASNYIGDLSCVSSNSDIATAKANGNIITAISGRNEGFATITVTSTGDNNHYGAEATFEIEVSITYFITYEYNGGSITTGTAPDKYKLGIGTELPSVEKNGLNKLGHVFLGWFTNSNFAGESYTSVDKDTYVDFTFYAKWRPIIYFANYNLVDGEFKENFVAPAEWVYGTPQVIYPPTKDDYVFTGWKLTGAVNNKTAYYLCEDENTQNKLSETDYHRRKGNGYYDYLTYNNISTTDDSTITFTACWIPYDEWLFLQRIDKYKEDADNISPDTSDEIKEAIANVKDDLDKFENDHPTNPETDFTDVAYDLEDYFELQKIRIGMLNVMFQLNNTTATSEKGTVRFITTVSDLTEFSSVGFKVTINSKTNSYTNVICYKTLLAADGSVVNEVNASDINSESQYLVTLILKNIPNANFNTDITVQAFAVTNYGEELLGIEKTRTITELINSNTVLS